MPCLRLQAALLGMAFTAFSCCLACGLSQAHVPAPHVRVMSPVSGHKDTGPKVLEGPRRLHLLSLGPEALPPPITVPLASEPTCSLVLSPLL